MGLSNLYSTWAELGYDPPELEESHEPDQTVLKVYLKTSRKSAKTREVIAKPRCIGAGKSLDGVRAEGLCHLS